MWTLRHAIVVAVLGVVVLPVPASDWPQFLGPNRNGSSPEIGLLAAWPREGPKLVWRCKGGAGHSQVAVAAGRAYTIVQRGDDEVLLALDAANGKELWSRRLEHAWSPGPSATPVIDGNRVYAQSMRGPLFSLNAADGAIIWQRDLLKEFRVQNTLWGMTVSPMIDGDRLFTACGGKGDRQNRSAKVGDVNSGVVALNKSDGKLLWKSTNDELGFASPVIWSTAGKKQAVFLTMSGVVAVQPEDGKVRWRFPWTDFPSELFAASPLVVGDRLFLASADDCALIQPAAEGEPKVLWGNKPPERLNTYNTMAVYHDRHLYGTSTAGWRGATSLNCVELATGKVVWSQKKFGAGSILLADGNLYIQTVKGELIVAPATPIGYQEKGRAKVLGQSTFVNGPTLAGKRLFARDQSSIICLELAR
jgi:outer membrane protein assembly factor BamB